LLRVPQRRHRATALRLRPPILNAPRQPVYEFLLSLLQVGTGDPDGTVALPAAGGRVSLVAREDVARCLAVDAVDAMAGYRYTETMPAEFAGTLLRLGEEPWWTYANE
jgi:NAD(P)H dehydrogenase (quinone)